MNKWLLVPLKLPSTLNMFTCISLFNNILTDALSKVLSVVNMRQLFPCYLSNKTST